MNPSYTKGQNLVLTFNGIPVGCDKQTNIEITTATFDVTSKCSVDGNGVLYAAAIPTIISSKFTGNGFVPILSSAGTPAEFSLMSIAQAQLAQTKGYATWSAPNTVGNIPVFFGQDVWITSIKAGAAVGEVITYDYEFTGDGPIITHPVS